MIELLIINAFLLVVIIYRQQKVLDRLEENSHAINDVWNHITNNPEMEITKHDEED